MVCAQPRGEIKGCDRVPYLLKTLRNSLIYCTFLVFVCFKILTYLLLLFYIFYCCQIRKQWLQVTMLFLDDFYSGFYSFNKTFVTTLENCKINEVLWLSLSSLLDQSAHFWEFCCCCSLFVCFFFLKTFHCFVVCESLHAHCILHALRTHSPAPHCYWCWAIPALPVWLSHQHSIKRKNHNCRCPPPPPPESFCPVSTLKTPCHHWSSHEEIQWFFCFT